MNESLVREELVYPFIKRLGYQIAGAERVRTGIPLKYSLGRKKATDPILRGRCDYICEVESYGRWIVEAKGGPETLTLNDAEQAHTYAHHPAVGAFFYLLTNGGVFRLFDRNPTRPVFEWTLAEMDSKWSIIESLLSPDAIRRRAQRYKLDIGKPLAAGLASKVAIVGGFLTYDEHRTNNSRIAKALEQIRGMRGTFTGRGITRSDAGLIRANLEVAAPYKEWDELNRAAGISGYEIESAVEFISTDPDRPTIFQGTTVGKFNTGQLSRFPGHPPQRLPIGALMTASTEAAGYIDGNKFKGSFSISYECAADDQPMDLSLVEGPGRDQLEILLKLCPREKIEEMMRAFIPQVLAQLHLSSVGTFEIVIQ